MGRVAHAMLDGIGDSSEASCPDASARRSLWAPRAARSGCESFDWVPRRVRALRATRTRMLSRLLLPQGNSVDDR